MAGKSKRTRLSQNRNMRGYVGLVMPLVYSMVEGREDGYRRGRLREPFIGDLRPSLRSAAAFRQILQVFYILSSSHSIDALWGLDIMLRRVRVNHCSLGICSATPGTKI
jgi:hypothetical protein